MNFGKIVLYPVIGLAALWLAGKVIGFAVGLLFQIVIPLAVVAGIGFVVYSAFSRRSLPASRNKTLP